MRIMVVEDEVLLRQGLINMINRMNLPCTIVASAADGEEALKQLSCISVDLIMTDIRMPKKDGMQLLGDVFRQYPKIWSIVISGYDDFVFAKQAMKLNCKDYILKPVIYSELFELLEQVCKEFEREQEMTLEAIRQRGVLNQSQYFLQNEFLKKFIHASKLPFLNAVIEEAKQLGIRLGEAEYAAVVMQFDDKRRLAERYENYDWMLMKYAVHNVVKEMTSYSPCFYDGQELLVALVDEWKDPHLLLQKCLEMQSKITELFKMNVSVGISNHYELKGISLGYKEAKRALKYRLVSDNSVILFAENVSDYTNNELKLFIDPLMELFDFEHVDLVQHRLKCWYESLKKAELSWEAMDTLEKELKVIFPALLRHFFNELGDDYSNCNLGAEIDRVESSDSFYTRMHPILNVLKEISSHHKKGKIESCTSEQVMKYIRAHYAENITLTTIAEQIYMSPTYLSVLFKRKTGKSIIEFLTEIRMEEAKRLLSDTDYKTYRIAEMIGYNDAAYFSNVFKKYNAVSPQEFRNASQQIKQ
ncbi:helix-turn-helix domain-containing protein [Paenibacillus montanisoli]|uniref:DNA-binding response regulator n=1 Tax=Paenibacillus montanisoli TaxID=2081970 RepID=A0A328UA88_9BACL|nr:helix-turn-helix domain-containing protein [Paenibacillus montanisoli]RAP77144.1 hypothetical protein DL346_01170 [Paenibacillus montanisoli]